MRVQSAAGLQMAPLADWTQAKRKPTCSEFSATLNLILEPRDLGIVAIRATADLRLSCYGSDLPCSPNEIPC
jgi:hypothetical protein